MSHTVYLALGTNLGDRYANLQTALDGISAIIDVVDYSQIYETPPWGYIDQPSFLNQVVVGESELSPNELLESVKNLEFTMGRSAGIRYGPRIIDIDILFFNQVIINSKDLLIPHPLLHERAFVLVPFMDIAPDLRHPVLGKTVRELLDGLDASGITKYQQQRN